MSATTAERLNDAVYRHKIMWTELANRIAENEGISQDSAAEMVVPLVMRESCSMPVAVALIDLICEATT